jgi:hypothetical protein
MLSEEQRYHMMIGDAGLGFDCMVWFDMVRFLAAYMNLRGPHIFKHQT